MPDIPARGFERSEFETRLHKAQALMAQQGFDGILLLSEPEVRYFSGFHTLFWQSPTRPWFLFLPLKGEPVAVIPGIGADLMGRTWVRDIRTWDAPNPDDDGISLLQDLLGPLNAARGTLGLLKGHETGLRMPLGDYERLMAGLPDLRVQDATGLIRQLRMVKSEAEIAKLAHICAIGSDTFDTVPEFAREGTPLEDVFRAFRRSALMLGADDVPYLVGGADQGGYHDVISPPSRRPLQAGDMLMLDTGATFDGYFCDFDRNFAIGRADDASHRAYDVLWRATQAGLDAARPGTTCRELFHAMRRVIAELDDQDANVGRLGHGLGMQLTEWPSHAEFDDTVLQEGMVITLEPSLSYGDSRTMVHEENLVIQDGAPRLLSRRAAPELPVI
ncbi:aminopeptidase P family protein [Tropicibacter sp. R16_0]|uniref:M24 family metallopeptidase n=1 Tax=Tropicibacter sp. R16_0 TaxID=2821102 RepID=UPI001ADCC044|nr:Xaa-Pro peptidase family protein [Tropicibacter sp. R16_0]MBO9448911.1 aminopeptidase P family protein [Tropicibacter sp. R16_0]